MQKKTKGFTLVELIIVIIILGILAALAIPQFFDSAKDAKITTTKANLAIMRNAISLYYVQHNSAYPGVTDPGANSAGSGNDSTTFVDQLTKYTNAVGVVSIDVDRTNYPFGPYLATGMPDNPYSTAGVLNAMVLDTTTVAPIEGTGAADGNGWKFATKTGKFISNQANDQSDEW